MKLLNTLTFFESNFREHYFGEDGYDCCPAHPDSIQNKFYSKCGKTSECTCGADAYNKELQESIDTLKAFINESPINDEREE